MNVWIRRIGLCVALGACALTLSGCIIIHEHPDDWEHGEWSERDR